jgi:hypothetical protein
LNGWIWPHVAHDTGTDDDIEPYYAFDALVSQADDEQIQATLIESIKRAWDESEHGVIIGSNQFDRIAPSPYYQYDALAAVRRVVTALGIKSTDVAVAMTASTPKIEHWGRIWYNHFSGANTYRDFVCSDDESDKRFEWLDSTMNTFGLASAYENEGYNVIVVDEDGTENLGLDIAHTLACNVMRDVECNADGYVEGAEDDRVPTMESYPIDSLSDNQLEALEDLFQVRAHNQIKLCMTLRSTAI